ncbi:MAG: AraC family transcriptional regulator [Clostridiales bacterium]|nr:AraC family transcriptional regulator [Clostridiales bacterium]
MEPFLFHFTRECPLDESILRQRPLPNDLQSLHYHDAFELGYCYSGEGLFLIDGEIMPFQEGAAVMIYRGQLHKAQSASAEGSEWVFLSADLALTLSDIDPSRLNGLLVPPEGFSPADCLLTEQKDPVIPLLIRTVIEELDRKEEGYRGTVRALLWAALSRHHRLMRDHCMEDTGTPDLLLEIDPAIHYLTAHFTEEVRIAELAALCHLSEATLRRRFRERLGLSPQDYLHQLRVRDAAMRLMTSDCSVSEAAYQAGYNTLSCFFRQFCRLYGISPTAWRKERRKHSFQAEEEAAF